MNIIASKALRLIKACGLTVPPDVDADRLTKFVNRLPSKIGTEQVIEDREMDWMLDEIIEALQDGEAVVVVPDAAAPAPVNPAPVAAAPPAAKIPATRTKKAAVEPEPEAVVSVPFADVSVSGKRKKPKVPETAPPVPDPVTAAIKTGPTKPAKKPKAEKPAKEPKKEKPAAVRELKQQRWHGVSIAGMARWMAAAGYTMREADNVFHSMGLHASWPTILNQFRGIAKRNREAPVLQPAWISELSTEREKTAAWGR